MSQNQVEPLMFLITGSRGAGKTSFCRTLVQEAREAGWRVAGILSLAVFEGNQRLAIEAEDLRNETRHRLASRMTDETSGTGPTTKNWQFDAEILKWGDGVLQQSTPCDLLVVDELGPLEFEREQGWQAGLSAVEFGAVCDCAGGRAV